MAFDGKGNVSALVNASGGTLSAQYEYGPFGELLRASGPMAKAKPLPCKCKCQSSLLTLPGWAGKRFAMSRKLRIEYPGAMYHVMNSEILREQAAVTSARIFSGTTKTAKGSWARWGRLAAKPSGRCMRIA